MAGCAAVTAEIISPSDAGALAVCLRALRAGEPVVIPTDTVYGLAACANNETAVAGLFALKQRPLDLSIAGLVADVAQAQAHTVFADSKPLADSFWPGPLTLIAQKRADSDLVIGAGDSTVGLRAPAHPFVRELASVVGPLAATSANLSGQPTLVNVDEIVEAFADKVAVIVDGGVLAGLASTVAKVHPSGEPGTGGVTVFREGALSEADLLQVLTA